jgi:plasmid maintenance system antidote protein VapI
VKKIEDFNPIKLILEDLGVTQAKFAESIGFAAPYINRKVNGHIDISHAVALSINEVYGYSLDFIMGKSKEMRDEAGQIIHDLHRIFGKISIAQKSSFNEEGEEIIEELLVLPVEDSLYNLLLDYERADTLKRESRLTSQRYVEEIIQIKNEFMKKRGEQKTLCVLVRENVVEEIIEANRRLTSAGKKLEELFYLNNLVDLGDEHFVYLDKEQ